MRLFPQKINTDLSDVAMQPDMCRNKLNMRSGLVSGSNALSNENIQSTVLIPSSYYETGDMVIGAFEDISNDSILFHVYNVDPDKNKILRYYPFDADRVELILKHKHLGYRPDWKITQGNIISGLHYFTFGYFGSFLNNDFSPPRKINIAKAKKFTDVYNSIARWDFTAVSEWEYNGAPCTYYLGTEEPTYAVGDKIVAWCMDGINRYKNSTGYSTVLAKANASGYWIVYTDRPWQDTTITGKTIDGYILPYATDQYFGIDWQVLDVIKYPPTYAPGVSYDTDFNTLSNNLRNNLFQFAYRFIYDDNEKSTWSPISDIPYPTVLESLNGSYDIPAYIDNVINVWVNSASIEVKTVQIAVRNGNDGLWSIVSNKNKIDEDGNILIQNDINILFQFYNNGIGEGIVQDDISRPYDFVPQISNGQELIEKNRVSYGDYVEGYDNVKIDVSLTNTQTSPTVGVVGGELTAWSNNVIVSAYAPMDQFYAGKIDFTGFYEAGFTYIINISAYPNTYDDPSGITIGGPSTVYDIYGPYANKIINSEAIVPATAGMSFEDFSNAVIANLRNGNFNDSVVIGLNAYDYKGFERYLNFITLSSESFPPAMSLGFIIELLGPGGCYYCSSVQVKVTKITGTFLYPTWKSGITEELGLFYFDRAMRHNAIGISDQSKIFIPEQTTDSGSHELYQNTISWSISHKPPEFATHYTWALAKNVPYFIYATASRIENINASNSVFICINQYIYGQSELIKKFNISPYVWEKGDRLRVIANKDSKNTYYTIPKILDFEIIGSLYPTDDMSGDTYLENDLGEKILDADGNKIKDPQQNGVLVSYFNYQLYNISEDNTLFQIYRPKKISDEKVFYAFGGILPIINPNTEDRAHGNPDGVPQEWDSNGALSVPASGTFKTGDCYLKYRAMINAFPCESLSYSDYFDSNVLSIGRPNIVDPNMYRKEYISYIRYSQILIENSLTNGLSTFYGSDFDVLPTKYEKIYSAKEVGEVLRVIQKNKCHSIYIGKGEMKQPIIGDVGVVAISPSVIGSRRDHSETFGTVFPESVVSSVNFTYFFDIYNSVYVRWSTNGLQQITYKESNTGWDYGMGVYFRNKCTALLASGLDNVKVYAVFEKEYENLIVTFVDSFNPENNETVVFHEPTNSWTMKCSFIPEFYGTNKKVLVMAKDGQLWKANSGPDRNTFFGVAYKSEIEVVGHEEPDKNYVFNDIEIVTNSDQWSAPNTGDVQVNLINGSMKSRLKNGRFTNREGVMVATFGKDMTTSGQEVQSDLVSGRELRGHAVSVRLENDSTDEVILTAVVINSTISE